MEVVYDIVKRDKDKLTFGEWCKEQPPREPYNGTASDLLLRRAALAAQELNLMLDWQDYNREHNNELPWDLK